MRTIQELQASIARLKQESDVCILAHSYQSPDILEAADVTGDSYQLSVSARQSNCKRLLVCGVRFMAETAKLLNPDKDVFEANPEAGCPMAEQFTPEQILAEKAKYPDCAVVAYVNTTVAIKAVSDVCVTSSSALQIVKAMPQTDILFIPDCNLGAYVQAHCPEKRIHLMQGGCPYHGAITLEEVLAAKQAHPNALLLVHPECNPKISAMADFVGATSNIMRYAKESDAEEFLIGTEISIVMHLSMACPDKRFYPMASRLICPDMRVTTLADVERVLREIADGSAAAVTLPVAVSQGARHSLEQMLCYGNG